MIEGGQKNEPNKRRKDKKMILLFITNTPEIAVFFLWILSLPSSDTWMSHPISWQLHHAKHRQ
jgi:hypothetical protein